MCLMYYNMVGCIAQLEEIQLRLVAVLADHGCDMIHREVLCILRDTLGQHPALAGK